MQASSVPERQKTPPQKSRSKTPERSPERKPRSKTPESKETHSSTSMPDSKKKLRTSEDVYHRIRWDASLNVNEYTVSYEDRFVGTGDVLFPLNKFARSY